MPNATTKILSLDGGGAKGFYTLGALRELEGMLGGAPLCEHFRLVFGTSTGSIIASLLALGEKVEAIEKLYREHVPKVTRPRSAGAKSAALELLTRDVFKDKKFDTVKTGIGIVATRWVTETPMIFKASIDQAHGRTGTFVPGFGCTIGDAVQASCSAHPFFNRKVVHTAAGNDVELIDGGYCANNPTLYAIADALLALKVPPDDLRVVSIGVGVYPTPKVPLYSKSYWINRLKSVRLLQKTLEINTQSMEQLRKILFAHIKTVRINDTYQQPEMATDLFESDLVKLNVLHQRGAQSFANVEKTLREHLI